MKIPGLNAPIPPGASFGYHPGGWGKPPVDEVNLLISFEWSNRNCMGKPKSPVSDTLIFTQYGRPLYGDVFGVQQQEQPNYDVCLLDLFHLSEAVD